VSDSSAAVDRPDPPALDWQPPLCPICSNWTVHHGYYRVTGATIWACKDCRATWRIEPGGDDAPGEWADLGEPQCLSEGRGRDGGVARCILGENHVDSDDRDARVHKGVCSNGHRMVWGTNTWVEETTPPAPKAERGARTAERIRAAKETQP
jgi:hypothetical protein